MKLSNINGIVLDKEQLKKYLENIASDHILKPKSDKETYPIPELEKNFEYITKTYDLLNLHLKLGINIHPAGEWLLDNYYIIEETVKEVRKNLSINKYTNFVGISSGKYKGFARSYVLATEIVAFTDGNFKAKDLEEYLISYQKKKTLNMEEIWDINLFFKIVLVERIKDVCTKIYLSQMQKVKVESIIERLVENKPKDELKFRVPSYEYTKMVQTYSENKYTFIEYLSYKLKRYGKKGVPYLNILEEEINKQGLTLQEVIKKEHYDIALKKMSIGNSIKSIHALQRINFLEIFEKINGVEEILKNDPSGIYDNMDYKTKEYYRNRVKTVAKKTKISEIYIAQKVIELAEKRESGTKEAHIGYYLISDGIPKLYESLGLKKKDAVQSKETKINLYINTIYILSIIISFLIGIKLYLSSSNAVLGIIEGLLIFILITEIVIGIIQNILNKVIKPKLIPKLDFSDGIKKEYNTMIVIPTIIDSKEKVRELAKKLEVYYLANKSENIYCTILGDCTSSKKEHEENDDDIKNTGVYEIERLNKKYPNENGIPKFNFLYRKRIWNPKEGCYLGWERKRGLLTELNEYLIYEKGDLPRQKKKNNFIVNTIEEYKLKNKGKLNIKYIITLDADTNLTLNSGIELIEAMAHPLNTPIIDEERKIVVDGFGIIQPRIGIDLESSTKSIYTEIFAGDGGVDSYTNAISDIYQDNFGEGIYTGKGIYDLDVFYKIMKDRIPENTVLSHDLLEGCFLRCGLSSDIMLLDGFPTGYISYITRAMRWIRGDFQIIPYLKNKDLSRLSKFKILDNIRRSLLDIFAILNIIFLYILHSINRVNIGLYLTISILGLITPSVIETINHIVFRKENIKRQKKFTNRIDGLKASFYRAIISISVLPHKAYQSLIAIIKTIYRMTVTKDHLLEWTTSEEAEKLCKKDLESIYINMFPNVLLRLFKHIYSSIYKNGYRV